MSVFEAEFSGEGAVCPYCKDIAHVEAEDYREQYREQTCHECGKKYHLQQIFDVQHETRPDCKLNDGEHRWIEAMSAGYEICDECSEFRRAEKNGSPEL